MNENMAESFSHHSSPMALLASSSSSYSHKTIYHTSSHVYHPYLQLPQFNSITLTSPSFNPLTYSKKHLNLRITNSDLFVVSCRYFTKEEDEDEEEHNFDEAVTLFNGGEYYKCHDYLESLWHNAEDPSRTLIHGILQCAVGFHHLFNQVLYFACVLLLIFISLLWFLLGICVIVQIK
jgi:hypothetical protein